MRLAATAIKYRLIRTTTMVGSCIWCWFRWTTRCCWLGLL